ncbi:arginase family protein [Rubrobacter indicoceani]|uniref:arginase family protein n=1 Tax=Rubrobacter indicoceani TaxID=2051957 RepID=UPI0013C4A0D6|nr:arginase family protein [Rubrobacter indicoceani]
MAAQVPGFSPVSGRNVVVAGSREIESAEQKRLDNSDVALFEARSLKDKAGKDGLDSALERLGERTRNVYLHLDLDVLDPEIVGAANEFAPASGLMVEEAERIVRFVQAHCNVAAVGIASYDPALDLSNNVLLAGVRLIGGLSRVVSG